MKNLTRIAVVALLATMSALTLGQSAGAGDPKAPFNSSPSWTVSSPTQIEIEKQSGEGASGEIAVVSTDNDTFIVATGSAQYFYLVEESNNQLQVNSVFVVGLNVGGVTADLSLCFNTWNHGYAGIEVTVPAGYSGAGFNVTFDAIDGADDPLKDSTQSKTVQVVVNQN